MVLLMGRAVVLGLTGALIGLVVVLILGYSGNFALLQPMEFIWIACLAPLMAAAATWLPALNAARSDPAVILSHD